MVEGRKKCKKHRRKQLQKVTKRQEAGNISSPRLRLYNLAYCQLIAATTQPRLMSCNQSETSILISYWLKSYGLWWLRLN